MKELTERAAALSGQSVTEFVVSSARLAAEHAVKEEFVLRLTRDESARLARVLMEPGQPNAALLRAAERRQRLFGE